MGIRDLIKKLKDKLFRVKDRKHKLALMEKNLRSMRYLAVEIKENGKHLTSSEKTEIEVEFERLKEEVKKLEAELRDVPN